jgi:formiminotetrahydrofolate cyclodeaminase
LREELKAAIDADAESYDLVMKAYKAAKTGAETQGEALIQAGLKQATSVPLAVAEKSREVGKIAASLGGVTNPNMKSDLTTAQALATAAVTGALANVDINLASVKDAGFTEDVRARVRTIKA